MSAFVVDVTIVDPLNPYPDGAQGYMLGPGATKADITPSSLRRTDGDAKFQDLQTDGYWSQTDWSAGIGARRGGDPASFLRGPCDTTIPNKIICSPGFAAGSATLGIDATAWSPIKIIASSVITEGVHRYYGIFRNPGNTSWAILRCDAGSDNWTAAINTAGGVITVEPSDICVFRNELWIAHAGRTVVHRIAADGTPTAVTGFFADLIEPYLSMLFGTQNISVVRYDPENPSVILTVARFSSERAPTAMRAAYGQLYILFPYSLWAFSSETGNRGVMVGPVDSWAAPLSPRAGLFGSNGFTLAAWQGSLIYGAGTQVRQYYPGGSGKVLYPIVGRAADWETGWGEVQAVATHDDRLYVALSRPGGDPQAVGRIGLWTGRGMHQWTERNFGARSAASAFPVGLCLATDGRVLLYAPGSWRTTGGLDHVALSLGLDARGSDPTEVTATPRWGQFRTSVITGGDLDFGLADLQKTISQIKLVGVLPVVGGAVTLEIRLDGKGGWQTLTPLAGEEFPRRAARGDGTAPGVVRYALPNGFLLGRTLAYRITLDGTGTSPDGGGIQRSDSPAIEAIIAQPNPVMPLRWGFKFGIEVGIGVRARGGEPLYQGAAAVDQALVRLRNLRRDGDGGNLANLGSPVTLQWIDGRSYRVRINTMTERRVSWDSATGPVYLFQFDAQEVR